MKCQRFIRAYPIPNGTASTTLCSLCSFVFVPKRRRKVIFGQTRRELGAIFHALAKGVSDYRGTPDAGPCAHMHRDSPQAPGSVRDRVSEREECYPDCPPATATTKL